MRRLARSVLVAAAIVLGLLIVSYSERIELQLARWQSQVAPGNVRIGVIYPAEQRDDGLRDGVRLAAEQANTEGGLLGRRLELVPIAEPEASETLNDSVQQALRIARRLAGDPDVIAAIGHSTSQAAVTASAVYAGAGKLYLAPYATSVSLVRHRLDTVFAMLPNNRVLAYVLAQYAHEINARRLVLITEGSEYGRETALFFSVFAEDLGIDIVYRDAFRPSGKSVEEAIAFLLDNSSFTMNRIDGIVVIAGPVKSGEFIEAARRLNISVPIMGTDAMNVPDVARIAGAGMRDVVAVTVFDPGNMGPEGRPFLEQFRSRYGGEPSLWATLGYDAVRLIVGAAQRIQSLDAHKIADLLRIMRFDNPLVGGSGAYGFTPRGEVIGKPAFVIRHDGQAFRFVKRYDSLPRFGGEDDEPVPPPGQAQGPPPKPKGDR